MSFFQKRTNEKKSDDVQTAIFPSRITPLETDRLKCHIDSPRSFDLVSLYRKNNSQYNNLITFGSPKISPLPQSHIRTLSDAKAKASEVNAEEKSFGDIQGFMVATGGATVECSRQQRVQPPAPTETARSHQRFNGLSLIKTVPVSSSKAEVEISYEILVDHWLWFELYRLWSTGYLKVFLLWASWMAVGTTFYSINNDFGWAKGFYMMVNVGYSIGSGYPKDTDHYSLWFSTFNILFGVIAIGIALNAFANSLVHTGEKWYHGVEYDRVMRDKSVPWKTKAIEWARSNKAKLYAICVSLGWGSIMTTWASYTFEEWKLVQALYFSVSFLSTGGLYPMPRDTDRYNLAIAGTFICIGVPLMWLAMGNITALLLKFGDPEKDKEKIRGQITKQEIDMMRQLKIDGGDGYLDRGEFFLLCAIRLGATTPELIEEINKRFVTLDAGKRGVLTRSEILQEKDKNILSLNERVVSSSMGIKKN